MLGLEDLAHAPLADRVDDVVVAEVEFLLTQAELLGLPAVQSIQLDELVGKMLVACLTGLDAGQEFKRLTQFVLRKQTASQGRLLEDAFGVAGHESRRSKHSICERPHSPRRVPQK